MILSLILTCVLFLSPTRGEDFPVRKPVFAGQFYPGSAQELRVMLKDLFTRAEPRSGAGGVVAVISPHAGYQFSGAVAASAINQIDPRRHPRRVFLLGVSHREMFEGAAVYAGGDFETPLGRIPVDRDLCRNLLRTSAVFLERPSAHREEHSLEVQLPFLQYHLQGSFQLVPILFGTDSPDVIRRVASTLKPYLTPENFFLISSDFSHYPTYADAVRSDKACAEAIGQNSPEKLLSTVARIERERVPNLATSMCGLSAVLTLLHMTEGNPQAAYTKVRYRNSGDSPYGDRSGVVGYWAIAVRVRPAPTGEPDASTQQMLLKVARTTLNNFLATGGIPSYDPSSLPAAARVPGGAFVTLRKGESLRGCIGRFVSDEPVYCVVQQMAVAAATEDMRFPPVSAGELEGLNIEISVLSSLQRIHSPDEFQLGRHGIYIRKGNRSGTFLPQVAAETGWSKEQFLGHCSRDKAGLGWDGWRDAELYVYEAYVFSEDTFRTQ